MKKAFAVLALGVAALAIAWVLRDCAADGGDASARTGVTEDRRVRTPPLAPRAPQAKKALLALFAVKPGEEPPELPQLTREERDLLPLIIERELTDEDGCDAAEIRREFRLFMEFGGDHADFLSAYRRKLLKRVLKQ